ncbi:MAG: hypothetical protein Phog2KO_43550 [Phototrophicaceae bacterium]
MINYPEKPKRRPQKKSFIRIFLISLIAIPAIVFAINTQSEQNLLQQGIAISVIICSSVYIVHQWILWLISSYLGLNDDNENV